jgi:hypothetical protein
MCLDFLKNLFGSKTPNNQQEAPVSDPNYKEYSGNPPDDVDKPEWEVVKISPNGITVSWQEKYGEAKQEQCVGLWYSASKQEYMLTYKDDKKIYLMKENINSIEAT